MKVCMENGENIDKGAFLDIGSGGRNTAQGHGAQTSGLPTVAVGSKFVSRTKRAGYMSTLLHRLANSCVLMEISKYNRVVS